MPILAHIAAQTKTIRLGAGVSVLPFHNPIRLAEEAAMVDLLSNGRLNLGVGRGSADYEYGNFKIDFDSRDDRFREVLDIILGLWTTEDFSYQGKYYQVDGITIAPRPLQRPHPPVHVAVSRTAARIDIAVARDMPVLTTYFTPVEDTLALMSLYSERCAAASKVSQMADMPFFRFIYLSEDEKEANEYPRKLSLGCGTLAPTGARLHRAMRSTWTWTIGRPAGLTNRAATNRNWSTTTSARRTNALIASPSCKASTASATLGRTSPSAAWNTIGSWIQ